MTMEAHSGSVYLRLQAGRCQRLSLNCMDLGVARDLRLMSEEYFAEAAKWDLCQCDHGAVPSIN